MTGNASYAVGLDLKSFFDTYLKSRNPLPLDDIMKSNGWATYSNAYANEFYLTKNEKPNERWRNFIQKRFVSEE